MKYKKDFNRKLIKKGSKLRLLQNGDYKYFRIGDFDSRLGWEIIQKGTGSHRQTGNFIYVIETDFPGDFELMIDN